MSHFTNIKTVIKDKECLKTVIVDFNYKYKENTITNDISINFGRNYEIFFQWNGEAYNIIADWWKLEQEFNIAEKKFVPELTRKYAYCKTKKALAESGFSMVDEEVNEDNEIVLTVRQW